MTNEGFGERPPPLFASGAVNMQIFDGLEKVCHPASVFSIPGSWEQSYICVGIAGKMDFLSQCRHEHQLHPEFFFLQDFCPWHFSRPVKLECAIVYSFRLSDSFTWVFFFTIAHESLSSKARLVIFFRGTVDRACQPCVIYRYHSKKLGAAKYLGSILLLASWHIHWRRFFLSWSSSKQENPILLSSGRPACLSLPLFQHEMHWGFARVNFIWPQPFPNNNQAFSEKQSSVRDGRNYSYILLQPSCIRCRQSCFLSKLRREWRERVRFRSKILVTSWNRWLFKDSARPKGLKRPKWKQRHKFEAALIRKPGKDCNSNEVINAKQFVVELSGAKQLHCHCCHSHKKLLRDSGIRTRGNRRMHISCLDSAIFLRDDNSNACWVGTGVRRNEIWQRKKKKEIFGYTKN